MCKEQWFSQLSFCFIGRYFLCTSLKRGKGIVLSFTTYFLIHGMCLLHHGKAPVTCQTKLSVAKHLVEAQDCLSVQGHWGTRGLKHLPFWFSLSALYFFLSQPSSSFWIVYSLLFMGANLHSDTCYPDMFVERVIKMEEGSVYMKSSVILRKRQTNLLLITLAPQHFYNIRFFIFNTQ